MIWKFLFLMTTIVTGMTLGILWPDLWTMFMSMVAGTSFIIGEWGHDDDDEE